MTESFWQYDCRKPPRKYNVVIVGGGFLGVSTAYWLRREASGLKIAVLDAGRLASGASGRNAGFILQGATSSYLKDRERYGAAKARKLWEFTRENRDLLISEVDEEAIELSASGSLTVAGDEREDAELQSSVRFLRRDGVPAAYFPADEVRARTGAMELHGGLYVSSGIMAHPVKLVRWLAERDGIDVLEHHRFLSYHATSKGAVVQTADREIRAERLVFCMGAATVQHFPHFSRLIDPVRAQMLAVEKSERRLQLPICSHNGFFYIRQAPGGEVLAGGARHLHEESERGFSDSTSIPVQRDIELYLKRHFPAVGDQKVIKRWSGTMSFSPDRLPIIGRIPDLPGSYWMAGCSGHGMAYGFRLGRLTARRLMGRSDESYWSLFSGERFDQALQQSTAA